MTERLDRLLVLEPHVPGRRGPAQPRRAGAVPRRPPRVGHPPLGRKACKPRREGFRQGSAGLPLRRDRRGAEATCSSSAPPVGTRSSRPSISTPRTSTPSSSTRARTHLVTDRIADYGGHIAENPARQLRQGRRPVLPRPQRRPTTTSSGTPPLTATRLRTRRTAGAFVLSESYLYTREAIRDSLEHLTPNGDRSRRSSASSTIADKPNRTTRYVGTARDALRKLGVDDPTRHIVVVTTPTGGPAVLSTILVKRTPFTDAEIARHLGSHRQRRRDRPSATRPACPTPRDP